MAMAIVRLMLIFPSADDPFGYMQDVGPDLSLSSEQMRIGPME